MELSDFQARADTADKKVAALNKRASELEQVIAAMQQQQHSQSKSAVVQTKESTSQQQSQPQSRPQQQQQQQQSHNAKSDASYVMSAREHSELLGTLSALRARLTADQVARTQLLKDNAKLSYRCAHLVRQLDTVDGGKFSQFEQKRLAAMPNSPVKSQSPH